MARIPRPSKGIPGVSLAFPRFATAISPEHVANHNKVTTHRESQRIVNQYTRSRFGRDKISAITKGKLRAWHVTMQDKPYIANRALA
jgi:hypothetical protein